MIELFLYDEHPYDYRDVYDSKILSVKIVNIFVL